VTNSSATFTGQAGQTYSFYSVTVDNVGNVENAPLTPDATITTPTIASITIVSNPTGFGFVKVDGVLTNTPVTFDWVSGSLHTLEALSPVSDNTGVRYVWSSWTDGGLQSHSFTVPGVSTQVTANYQIQYQVFFKQSGSAANPTVNYSIDGGSTLSDTVPFSVWVNSSKQITYTFPSPIPGISGVQYVLTNTMPSSPQTVNSAFNVTTDYKTQYQVSFAVNPQGSGTVSPNTITYFDAGSAISISAAASSSYMFSGWSSSAQSITFAGSSSSSSSATINGSGTITADFATAPTPSPTPTPTPAPTPIPTTQPTTASTPTPTTRITPKPTQTPTPTTSASNSPSPSPTIPELTPLVLVALLAIVTISTVIFRRKQRKIV
jgi:hypothetical protein